MLQWTEDLNYIRCRGKSALGKRQPLPEAAIGIKTSSGTVSRVGISPRGSSGAAESRAMSGFSMNEGDGQVTCVPESGRMAPISQIAHLGCSYFICGRYCRE